MTFQSLALQRFCDLYDKLPAEIQGAGRQTVRAIFRASRPSFVEVQACRAVLAGNVSRTPAGRGQSPWVSNLSIFCAAGRVKLES
jgi:hypothetical protein